jgi:hypothetical protein
MSNTITFNGVEVDYYLLPDGFEVVRWRVCEVDPFLAYINAKGLNLPSQQLTSVLNADKQLALAIAGAESLTPAERCDT